MKEKRGCFVTIISRSDKFLPSLVRPLFSSHCEEQSDEAVSYLRLPRLKDFLAMAEGSVEFANREQDLQ